MLIQPSATFHTRGEHAMGLALLQAFLAFYWMDTHNYTLHVAFLVIEQLVSSVSIR